MKLNPYSLRTLGMQAAGRSKIYHTLMTAQLFYFSLKVIITVKAAKKALSRLLKVSQGEKIHRELIQLEKDYHQTQNIIQIVSGKHNWQVFICLFCKQPVPEVLQYYLYLKHLYYFLLVSSTSLFPPKVTVFSLSSFKKNISASAGRKVISRSINSFKRTHGLFILCSWFFILVAHKLLI